MATNKYHGPIWGDLPSDFPTSEFETTYRGWLDVIGSQTRSAKLMGQGLKGVAYRFRGLVECDEAFTESVRKVGYAPPVDDHYRQEAFLFGFFVNGLSCLESFFFAMHAFAAFHDSKAFGLKNEQLQRVSPQSVTAKYEEHWPTAILTPTMRNLVNAVEFTQWKKIRNMLTHRVVPPRSITISVNGPTNVVWRVDDAGTENADEKLGLHTTGLRRAWLSNQLKSLVTAFGQFKVL